jgi:uncharacterized pyridoxamine 5'-phosphate oxidase family protein
MNDVVKFLSENPIQYLSTIGLDGKPKNRPFMFALEKSGKLWYCTSNTKEVYKELQKSPYVEISVSTPEYAWIRLKGKAIFKNDIEIKKMILAAMPIVKNIYKTENNPVFEVFYLDEVKATITDFSGNPPKEYVL